MHWWTIYMKLFIVNSYCVLLIPSVLWHSWLDGRKGIRLWSPGYGWYSPHSSCYI